MKGTVFTAVTLVFAFAMGTATRLRAQEEDVSLRVSRMVENQKNHAETEGDLIHLMIRHSLGLKADAGPYMKLTKSEASVTLQTAKAMLREIEKDLARRAAELREKGGKIGGTIPTAPNAAPDAAPHGTPYETPDPQNTAHAGAPSGVSPTTAPGIHANKLEVPMLPEPRKPAPWIEPGGVKPTAAADDGAKSDPEKAPTKRKKVIAIITGSSDHSAVGRVLFQAGKFETALSELQYLETDKQAPYADLFILARCNEELHKAARSKSDRIDVEAKSELAAADAAAIEVAAMQKNKTHSVAAGGTYASAREYERLATIVTRSRKKAASLTEEFKKLRKTSADRFEKAYEILLLIEGRDVTKNADAVEVLGEWGKAARSARNVMRWLDSKGRWVAPIPKWSGD